MIKDYSVLIDEMPSDKGIDTYDWRGYMHDHYHMVMKALKIAEVVYTMSERQRLYHNAVSGHQIAENAYNQGWNEILLTLKGIE